MISILLIIFVFVAIITFIFGIIISIILTKKGKRRMASNIKKTTCIIIFIIVMLIVVQFGILWMRSEEYLIEMSIEQVNSDYENEIHFTIQFGNKEKSFNMSELKHGKIMIWEFKKGKSYKFSIISKNFQFINSSKSVSGNISNNNNNIRLNDISSESRYYKVILKESHKIKVQTIGDDGEIIFMFKAFTTWI